MEWRNVLLDELPDDKQPALICYLGIYYATVFDAGEKRFYFRDDRSSYVEIRNEAIYWIEM
jgi:hypothetical protein